MALVKQIEMRVLADAGDAQKSSTSSTPRRKTLARRT